jgi:hypothetical protein
LGGQKATLVWDGLPVHRGLAMAAWLRGQRSWLVTGRLPAYAPELNPVEGLWASLKGVELATWPATPLTRSPPRLSAACNASEAPTGGVLVPAALRAVPLVSDAQIPGAAKLVWSRGKATLSLGLVPTSSHGAHYRSKESGTTARQP